MTDRKNGDTEPSTTRVRVRKRQDGQLARRGKHQTEGPVMLADRATLDSATPESRLSDMKGGSAEVRQLPVRGAGSQPPVEPQAQPPAMPRSVGPGTPNPAGDVFVAARPRRRHFAVLISFVVCVVLPALLWTGYLYTRAADQYHSVTAFSVRSEDAVVAPTGLTELLMPTGTSGASDTDILYDFIQSQSIVERLSTRLDLDTIFNRAGPGDWLFSLGADRPVEDMLDYWDWMVDVAYDPATGIIEVTSLAFTATDAQAISAAILAESTALVNRLSEEARSDAIRYAAQDLAEAEDRLKTRRTEVRDYRNQHQIVDPEADVIGQMGVLTELERVLAEAMVAKAEILEYAQEGDSRLAQVDRRIRAIQTQIVAERAKLGSGEDQADANGLSDVIGRFEELKVDLEFAEATYVQARASFDQARAEARRQSRYLAAHVEPTLAQSAQYPQRALLAGFGALFLLFGWAVVVLLAYNIRDRR